MYVYACSWNLWKFKTFSQANQIALNTCIHDHAKENYNYSFLEQQTLHGHKSIMLLHLKEVCHMF